MHPWMRHLDICRCMTDANGYVSMHTWVGRGAACRGGPGEGRPPWGPVGEGYTGVGTSEKTIQSPDRLYKDPTDHTKTQKHYTKPLNIRQNLKSIRQNLTIWNKNPKYQTIVATIDILTANIQYPILTTTYINKKVFILIKGCWLGPYCPRPMLKQRWKLT